MDGQSDRQTPFSSLVRAGIPCSAVKVAIWAALALEVACPASCTIAVLKQKAQIPQRKRASAVVTQFKIIQDHWCQYQSKPVCDFLFVNYILSRTIFQLMLRSGQSPMTRGAYC